MAKHDQRILKFLNQNADRAPTITEMMTRLNISISDISDSLGSLQSQGLISKKTDNQGIECWFPTGPQASPQQVQPMQVHAPHLAAQHMATTTIPVQTAPMDNRYREDTRFGSGPHERTMQAPDAHPPTPKASPVQVSHIPMAPVSEPAYQPREIPPQPEPSFNGSAPLYPLSQPASRGIGVLTFAAGLVIAVGVSVWLGGRTTAKEIKKASTTFVDKKALLDATTAFNDFQEKTKSHVTALEAEVKQLTAQLATSKAAAESLLTTAAKSGGTDEAADAKGKAGKKTAAAKAKPAAVSKGKASKSASGSNAISKAAARGAAKRKAAMARSTSSDYSASESGSSESVSPSVPEPPGLEDLPPPPPE